MRKNEMDIVLKGIEEGIYRNIFEILICYSKLILVYLKFSFWI